jgi:hypothetical protein
MNEVLSASESRSEMVRGLDIPVVSANTSTSGFRPISLASLFAFQLEAVLDHENFFKA